MGMFDTIFGIPVKCPRCGDENGKSAQIKNGPQYLERFEFGKDKIPMHWDYGYYGSIIQKFNKENGKIRGIAECTKCRERVNNQMDEIISGYKKEGKLKCPEGVQLLIECEIEGKDALKVVLDDLDNAYGGNHYSEYLFDISIKIENSVAVGAEVLEERG